jgi:hypothetical protein
MKAYTFLGSFSRDKSFFFGFKTSSLCLNKKIIINKESYRELKSAGQILGTKERSTHCLIALEVIIFFIFANLGPFLALPIASFED